MESKVKDYINVLIIISFASIIAVGGGNESLDYNGYPILILCMIASFIVHWIIFIPSFLAKTEKFYDITGTLAYIIILYVASVLTSYSSGVSLELRTKIIIGELNCQIKDQNHFHLDIQIQVLGIIDREELWLRQTWMVYQYM